MIRTWLFSLVTAVAWALSVGLTPGRAELRVRATTPLTNEQLVGDPRVWRAFRPVVRFAGGGDAEQAIGYLRKGSDILRRVEGNLVLEPAIARFREEALASLKDFDVARLYALLPESAQTFRRWTFEGFPEAQGYRVRAPQRRDFEVNARGARRRFGETSGVLRARPTGDNEDRYLLQWRGGIGLGELPWQHVKEGLSDALRVVESSFDADAPYIVTAAEAFLQKSQPELGPKDRRLLGTAWASFPHIAEHLIGVSRTEDVVVDRQVEGCTEIRAVSRFLPERIGREYPHLAKYLTRFDNVADLQVRLFDATGSKLSSLRVNTERLETAVSAFVKDGALVASRGGRPRPHLWPDYTRMTAVIDLHLVLHGVHIQANDFRVRLRYTEQDTGATLQAVAREVPRLRVSGAAWGLVPTRLVDWFVRGDLEGLATRFYESLIQGNEGRGLSATLRFAHAPGTGLTTVDGSAGAELLDNGLLRFALRAFSGRLVPDDAEEADLRRLALAYRDAFDADLNRFAEFGQRALNDGRAPEAQ